MKPALVAELRAALSVPVIDDPDVLFGISRDYAPIAPCGTASVLVRAKAVRDVTQTLRFAHQHRIPVVTRGGGTGLAGGANALDGCIMLSVLGMNKILALNAEQHFATVEPGVITAAVADAAASLGLYYPPDPSSREISTIGGNIATNAGGACCLKYGVTGDHVAGMKAVLADGTLIQTGANVAKNVAGLDLNRLLIGSEGTLAVIVEATLRLRKKPGPASTLLAFFRSMGAAAKALASLDAENDLSLLELMDQTTVGAVEAMTKMDLDTTAGALVLLQSDAINAAQVIDRCRRICEAIPATSVLCTEDREEGRLLLKARYAALTALERMGTTLLDDVGVPKPAIATLFEKIAQISSKHALVIGTFGHAGDGNFHPTIVFDHKSESALSSARAAFDEIVHVALSLGGTVTGEHGVGSLKTPYMDQMVGRSERALMQRIKSAFDPHGILNPGRGF
jgi:glycolate oxidase